MKVTDSKIGKIMFIEGPEQSIEEVQKICSMLDTTLDFSFIIRSFDDVSRLFSGNYKGFQACNTKYHDLNHTIDVFIAVARLIHGIVISGKQLSHQGIILGLIAALFHDAGFIQTIDDTEGTGAKYTIGHEERSIEFINHYLSDKGYSSEAINDCGHMIACTILRKSLREIPFRTEEVKVLGQIVGTADLLAQMADRNYLEKLLFLYKEFEEAKMPGFDSELELLKKTEAFYRDLSKKRMNEELGGVDSFMYLHFKNRWRVDLDLYQVYARKNIAYLKAILRTFDDDYRQMLRRAGVVEKLHRPLDT
ncbi:hypothetical protein ACFL27_08405 [candidate division CSSED10-310 bacterium]|uniref:HD/PDEase domain-containing protein n=1 Tax=candidate division CSSED10-310 bacterium TaxID=2855610 RepID=A0ABV6YVG5_UNCC1